MYKKKDLLRAKLQNSGDLCICFSCAMEKRTSCEAYVDSLMLILEGNSVNQYKSITVKVNTSYE